jgi:hypothetical protein
LDDAAFGWIIRSVVTFKLGVGNSREKGINFILGENLIHGGASLNQDIGDINVVDFFSHVMIHTVVNFLS